MKNFFVKFIATGAFSGFIQPFSGTWGTIPALAISYFFIGNNPLILWPIAIVTIFISIWAATEAEKLWGHDNKKIVIDEWAGMFITLLYVPVSIQNYIIAFVMFRFFDVAKVPPASQFERLKGGYGITMDDVMAGVYACFATHGIIWLLKHYGITFISG